MENGLRKPKQQSKPTLWKWLFFIFTVNVNNESVSKWQPQVSRQSQFWLLFIWKAIHIAPALRKAEIPQSRSSTTTSSMNKFLLPHKCLPSLSFWPTVYSSVYSSVYLLSLEETRERHSLCTFWHYWEHTESKTDLTSYLQAYWRSTVSLGTAWEKEFLGGSSEVGSRQPGPRQPRLPKLEPHAAPGRVWRGWCDVYCSDGGAGWCYVGQELHSAGCDFSGGI